MKIKLTRKLGNNSGLYTTTILGEVFNITRFEGDGGGWIMYSKSDPYGYSDPIPTLYEVRKAVEEMTIQRGVAKAWAALVTIAQAQAQQEADAITNAIPEQVHKTALMYAAARAIIDRKVNTSDNYAVWDVIDEFGRSRKVNGAWINNPFYDHLDVNDWEASDNFRGLVLTVAKALAS